MRFPSTRGQCPAAELRQALFQGLAPDGGLYIPEHLPPLPADFLHGLAGTPLAETAFAVLRPFVDDVPEAELRRLLEEVLSFPIPLVPLEEGVFLLELFHGPTLAFKDVGARFMARLMAWYRRRDEAPLTVLVATSGDTGSAVAQAFHGVAGTRVAVLYPKGQVSELQERQITTLGGNIQALAVSGTFDDCQRMVKEAFADESLRRALPLTSANSINIGRLLPQALYYLHAAAQLPAGAPPVVFAVPSGNFGNLTAGLFAQRMGLACRRFVAATNVNDVVPEYLETGRFSPRLSVATLSNAMDVGDPSNFERIQWLFGGELGRVRRHITGTRHDDEATRRTVARVFQRTGRILDPHTAVGYLGLQEALAGESRPATGIVLATAHPAKFGDAIEPLIGEEVPLPERLAACLHHPRRSLPLAADAAALKELLLGWEKG